MIRQLLAREFSFSANQTQEILTKSKSNLYSLVLSSFYNSSITLESLLNGDGSAISAIMLGCLFRKSSDYRLVS